MTPEQLTLTQQIAQAIDVLQDNGVLGDNQSDHLFETYLKDIGSSYEEYWETLDSRFAQIYKLLRK